MSGMNDMKKNVLRTTQVPQVKWRLIHQRNVFKIYREIRSEIYTNYIEDGDFKTYKATLDVH